MVCKTQPETDRYAELLRKTNSWSEATAQFQEEFSQALTSGQCAILQITYNDRTTFDQFENGQMMYWRTQITISAVYDTRTDRWAVITPRVRYAVLWSQIEEG
jgi:hypothetical protein